MTFACAKASSLMLLLLICCLSVPENRFVIRKASLSPGQFACTRANSVSPIGIAAQDPAAKKFGEQAVGRGKRKTRDVTDFDETEG
jgi:hypothetical protein